MARDEITLQYVTYDAKDRVGSTAIEKQSVTQANGIKLKNAYACKDNSMVIYVENTSNSASTVTIKAGEKQNKLLGDASVAVAKATTAGASVTEIRVNRDGSSFERNDGSIDIDFASGFTGNIWATAEKAGLGS